MARYSHILIDILLHCSPQQRKLDCGHKKLEYCMGKYKAQHLANMLQDGTSFRFFAAAAGSTLLACVWSTTCQVSSSRISAVVLPESKGSPNWALSSLYFSVKALRNQLLGQRVWMYGHKSLTQISQSRSLVPFAKISMSCQLATTTLQG